MRVPDTWVGSYRGCDIAQDVLTLLGDDENGPAHVFADIMQTLPPKHIKKLQALRSAPQASADNSMKVSDRQFKYLQTRCSDAFGSTAVATNCTKHVGQACPLEFQRDPTCAGHDKLLKVNFSGPMCTPWSTAGRQLGDADPSLESYYVWLTQMQQSGHDMIFLENARLFPWEEKFAAPMAKRFETYRLIFGAQDMTACCLVHVGL